MRRLLGVAVILLITLSAAPLAAQKCEPNDEQCRKAEELRDYIKAKLHQVRIHGADARWGASVCLRLRAERHF